MVLLQVSLRLPKMIHKEPRHFLDKVFKPELLPFRVESFDDAVDSFEGAVVHLVVGIHSLPPIGLVSVEHPTVEEVGEECVDSRGQLIILEFGRLPLGLFRARTVVHVSLSMEFAAMARMSSMISSFTETLRASTPRRWSLTLFSMWNLKTKLNYVFAPKLRFRPKNTKVLTCT